MGNGPIWGACGCGAAPRGNGLHAVAIRPENVRVGRHPAPETSLNRLEGRLRTVLNRGFYAQVRVDVDGLAFHAIDSRRDLLRDGLAEGDPVHLAIAAEDIHLIPEKPGERLKAKGARRYLRVFAPYFSAFYLSPFSFPLYRRYTRGTRAGLVKITS